MVDGRAFETVLQLNTYLRMITAGLLILGLSAFASVKTTGDCWLSVDGSGVKDGSSRENAYSIKGNRSIAQKCWEQTAPGGTMYVLPGSYTKENDTFWSLTLEKDRDGDLSQGLYKTLQGIGEVSLSGSRPSVYDPKRADRGETWLTIKRGASHLRIRNFSVSNVKEGISAKAGGNDSLRFENLSFRNTRQNVVLYGHPSCRSTEHCPVKEKDLSRNIHIQKVNGFAYSKRHIRLSHGVRHVFVIDSHADANYLDEDFAVGFDAEKGANHITFLSSSARRNVYTLAEYWNGDGFKAEKDTHTIKWLSCEAYDNGDAGFDIKTPGAVLENIRAHRNKRNVRVWSHSGAILRTVDASFSMDRGGVGGDAGLWTQGLIHCHECTLRENGIPAMMENNGRPASVRLYDSVVLLTDTETSAEWMTHASSDGNSVELIRTVINPARPAKT